MRMEENPSDRLVVAQRERRRFPSGRECDELVAVTT